jgi:hypothetical protein
LSVQTPTPGASAEERSRAPEYDEGSGWVTFAGVLLMIVGVMNVIAGIAAVDDSTFYAGDARFILSDLNTWGWVVLVLGVVQVLTAFGVWARNGFARWLAVGFVGVNAVIQLMLVSAAPFLSLMLYGIDIVIIYALVVAYGRREAY